MYNVIDGKLYNTDTATLLHEWNNGLYGKFQYCEEALYVTAKGAYFIYGYGGPASRYACSEGPNTNSRTSGEGIRPVTKNRAIRWLKEHDGEEVLLKRFPDYVDKG